MQGKTGIEEHAGIIVEALEDYRRWWDDDNDPDGDERKGINDAIEFIESWE